MLSGGKVLLRRGKFEFEIGHLLIIAVLAICFTTAFIMRAYPMKYGFYLNEFDPYFDYRATKYIVDNGLGAYLSWHDTMSWYPEGRSIKLKHSNCPPEEVCSRFLRATRSP